MNTRYYWLSALLLLAFGFAEAQSITRGPYLQFPSPSSMIVRWRTDVAGPSEVWYGSSQGNLNQSVTDTTSVTDHEVEISGLSPYSKYFYLVGPQNSPLSGPDVDHYFITQPTPGTVAPYRIWCLGDFGKGNSTQKKVRDAYEAYTQDKETDVWIWLGDNAYDTGSDSEYQQKVFDSATAYYHIFKHLPFMACPGNHDYGSVNQSGNPSTHSGPYYDIVNVPTNGELGGVPSNMEAYYSYDYGNIHMVSLNSELYGEVASSNSTMANWLKSDLGTTDKKWKIVYFHQPPYSKGSHDSDDFWELIMLAMRQNYTEIFEQYGVDMVICGHSHVYERSYLIKDHTGNSGDFGGGNLVDGSSGSLTFGEPYLKDTTGPNANEGTVYAVVGNGGSKTSNPDLNHPAMYFGYGCDTCVGSMIIDILGDTLTSRFLTGNGAFLDEFTIIKTEGIVNRFGPLFPGQVTVAPNPFRTETTVTLDLDRSANLKLDVYNLRGQLIRSIFNGEKSPGQHQFRIGDSDNGLAPGMYQLRISDGQGALTKRILKIN